jgi:hypothetical protein
MARYAVVERPESTPDVPQEFLILKETAARLEARVKQSTRLVNQLHNLLARVFPELATVAPKLSAGWVLELLRKYPTPERIARARLASLTAVPYLTESKA